MSKTEVYRVGDFKWRSDTLSQMSGRSTGFFGTGYYFCTKPERCAPQGGGHRPLYKMVFDEDKIKLLYGTRKRHEALKLITRYLYSYEVINNSDFENLKNFAYYAVDYYNERHTIGEGLKDQYECWGEGQTWLEYVNDNYDIKRLLEKAKNVSLLKPFYEELSKEEPDFEFVSQFQKDNTGYFKYDYLKNLHDLGHDAEFQALLEFNLGREEFKKIAEDIHDIYKDFYEKGAFVSWKEESKYTDSISTTFLRILGYDGVYPSGECDDTTYGGVIFDMESFEYEKLADDVSEYLE